MNGPTHVVGGALAGLSVSAVSGVGAEGCAAITVGAIATSKLPDLDRYIDNSPQHRSFPHSLILGGGGFMIAALMVMGLLASGGLDGQIYSVFGGELITPATLHFALVGSVAGYLTHLGLDSLTSSGIWLLWPKGKRIGLPRKKAIRSGGVTEHAISALMLIACLGLAAYLLVLGTGAV